MRPVLNRTLHECVSDLRCDGGLSWDIMELDPFFLFNDGTYYGDFRRVWDTSDILVSWESLVALLPIGLFINR